MNISVPGHAHRGSRGRPSSRGRCRIVTFDAGAQWHPRARSADPLWSRAGRARPGITAAPTRITVPKPLGALALVSIVWINPAIALDVNRCVDAKGRVTFQDEPCPRDPEREKVEAAKRRERTEEVDRRMTAEQEARKAMPDNPRGANEAPVPADFPPPWISAFNLRISRALVQMKLRGCGQYRYRESLKQPGDFLVECNPDGRTWHRYRVRPAD